MCAFSLVIYTQGEEHYFREKHKEHYIAQYFCYPTIILQHPTTEMIFVKYEDDQKYISTPSI